MIGIYMIENLIDHKRYIGQTINYNRRLYLHLHYLRNGRHSNKYLQAAWNKYGEDNFRFCLFHDITKDVLGLSRPEVDRLLDEYEIAWIDFYKASDPEYGYNLSAGGDGATLFGDRNPTFGKSRSESVRNKISATIKSNNSHAGVNNGRFGKPVSAETRRKISEANRGRKLSAEDCRRRSEIMRSVNQRPDIIARKEARKNDPDWQRKWAEIGKSRRKYTDEFLAQLRSEYGTDADIKILADKYNLRYKLVMEIVHRNGHFTNR